MYRSLWFELGIWICGEPTDTAGGFSAVRVVDSPDPLVRESAAVFPSTPLLKCASRGVNHTYLQCTVEQGLACVHSWNHHHIWAYASPQRIPLCEPLPPAPRRWPLSDFLSLHTSSTLWTRILQKWSHTVCTVWSGFSGLHVSVSV